VARPLRLEFPGALWHITNRGVEQRSIYGDDSDRIHFLQLLEKVIDNYRWQLRAYVLMSNHYHLFFRTPETNLSRGMKDLDGDYASFFNDRHRRAGHLFQGRFKGHLVDSENYLLSLARYIVLNPVRAGMVETPAEWRWSSYRATAGLAAAPRWLDHGPILDAFNADDWNKAMHGYRDFVAAGMGRDVSPWENLLAGMFLGGNKFLREVETKVRERKRSDEHPRAQRAFRSTTIESVRKVVAAESNPEQWPPHVGSEGRLLFALLAERHTAGTRAQIGELLGITRQGAGHLISVALDRLNGNPGFAARVGEIEDRLREPD
jgi:REP element-mobilizing transposase RayT